MKSWAESYLSSLFVHVCVSVECARVYTMDIQVPTDQGVGITGGCEKPNADAGNRILVLWKRLNHRAISPASPSSFLV